MIGTPKERKAASWSLRRDANSMIGICETLRLVYDKLWFMEDKELLAEVTEILIDCMIMAKKMDDRLNYYKKLTQDTTGTQGSNLVCRTNTQAVKRMRKARR